jgi:TonB family protein
MGLKSYTGAVLLLALSLGFRMAAAQESETSTADEAGVYEHVKGLTIPAIAGEPFNAKVSVLISRRLPDGGSMRRRYYVFISRDSVGRRYRESRGQVPADSSAEPPLLRTEVTDPVAGTRTTCRTAQRTCWVNTYQLEQPAKPEPVGLSADGKSSLTRESLDATVLHGLLVQVTKETRTFSSGSVGNDQPVAVTSTFWHSPKLDIDLRVERNDPRTSDQTIEVTELSLGEPKPERFAVPQAFNVVDQRTAQVSVTRPDGSGITYPLVIHTEPPEYPEEERKATGDDFSGKCWLNLVVDKQGKPKDIKVSQSLSPAFDAAAIRAISKYRFRPGLRNGQPVDMNIRISVEFRKFDRR